MQTVKLKAQKFSNFLKKSEDLEEEDNEIKKSIFNKSHFNDDHPDNSFVPLSKKTIPSPKEEYSTLDAFVDNSETYAFYNPYEEINLNKEDLTPLSLHTLNSTTNNPKDFFQYSKIGSFICEEFATNYKNKFPILAMVDIGFLGQDRMHTYRHMEQLRINYVVVQKRAIMIGTMKKTKKQYAISIPVDAEYPYKFNVHINGGIQSLFLSDIVDKIYNQEEVKLEFQDKKISYQVDHSIEKSSIEFGLLSYVDVYEMRYLNVTPVSNKVDGGIELGLPKLLPIYLPITLAPCIGCVSGDKKDFHQLLYNVEAEFENNYYMVDESFNDSVLIFNDLAALAKSNEYDRLKLYGFNYEHVILPKGNNHTIVDVSTIPSINDLLISLPFSESNNKFLLNSKSKGRRNSDTTYKEKSNTNSQKQSSDKSLVEEIEEALKLKAKQTNNDMPKSAAVMKPIPSKVKPKIKFGNAESIIKDHLSSIEKKNPHTEISKPIIEKQKPHLKNETLPEIPIPIAEKNKIPFHKRISVEASANSNNTSVGIVKPTVEHIKQNQIPKNEVNLQNVNELVNISSPTQDISNKKIKITTWDEVPSDVTLLSVNQLCDCLKLMHLSHYEEKFKLFYMDGSLLCKIENKTSLMQQFGMTEIEALILLRFSKGWKP